MSEAVARLRTGYGADLRHALFMILCLGVAGWVVLRLAGEATSGRMLLWFVGAVVSHDLILFPCYAIVDRALRRAVRGRGREVGPARSSLLNHVRIPALAAGVLFLVFLPGILGLSEDTYRAATGQDRFPYLARWLAISGGLFLISATVWVIRWARWRHRSGPPSALGPG
ncbi:hypothetical protein [Micromonospora sp. NPDC005413]|uniref:hypothetical protein n=1 Tax=Micromonospora sp. NPDC005413 TaxID=3154563 RepID=UPI0033B02F49